MWIDDEGVLNTVSLPDPTKVMAGDFRDTVDQLRSSHPEALRDVIECAEERAYNRDWSDLDRSPEYVATPAPADLLRGPVTSAADVATAIDGVRPRWRLDVVLALDAYLN